MSKTTARIILSALAALAFGAASASAHPHVWVTMKAEIVYAPDGTLRGVRHAWTFDDMFSAFATQGLDSKKRGVFTREELLPLAKTNIESLREFDYFTEATIDGKKADFIDPPMSDAYLEYKDEMLTLVFMLPFKAPVKARELSIEVYDSGFFVDFSFDERDKNPVALAGAPVGCKLVVIRPAQMDAAMQLKLFQMSPDEKLAPGDQLGAQFASRVIVKCS